MERESDVESTKRSFLFHLYFGVRRRYFCIVCWVNLVEDNRLKCILYLLFNTYLVLINGNFLFIEKGIWTLNGEVKKKRKSTMEEIVLDSDILYNYCHFGEHEDPRSSIKEHPTMTQS